jgi:hypothetical protein
MAKSGNGRLEEAMALLIHNQAEFVAQLRETNAQHWEADKRMSEMARENRERFARIEALLLEHNRMLQALPEAVRQKIGFAVPTATG